PAMVERHGITPETGRAAIDARTSGRRVKLVVRAGREGDRVTARVAPETLADDDLLAMLEGQQNAIILQTDLLEEIAIVQRSGSLTPTAYALLSGLMAISRAGACPRGAGRGDMGRPCYWAFAEVSASASKPFTTRSPIPVPGMVR